MPIVAAMHGVVVRYHEIAHTVRRVQLILSEHLDTALSAAARRGAMSRSAAARRFFGKKGSRLLTHVGVLGEAVTFLRYRFGHVPARRLGDHVRSGRALTLLPIELPDDLEGWRSFLRPRLRDCGVHAGPGCGPLSARRHSP